MKTTLDQSNAIFNLLNVPEITSMITGAVRKERRDLNSEKEDIVIKSLTLGEGSRQFGVAFVNIHVKDVSVTGRPGLFPNTARLEAIAKRVVPLLEETDGDDFVLYIVDSRTVEEPQIDQHYLNLRVEVQMYNFI